MSQVIPTILILAGKRDGRLDPLAEAHGVSHKAVVPIRGKPLIQWVLEAAEQAWPDAPILVSIHDPAVIDGLPIVQRLTEAGRLRIVEAGPGIVDSVHMAAGTGNEHFPLIITTGDNVLATAESLRELHEAGLASGADAAAALTTREAIFAAHPEGQRRFYEFSDVAISNCNAYWLAGRKGLAAAEAFRGGGQFSKRKGAIVKAFGLINLIRFRFRLATLDGTMRAISRRFGVKVIAHLYADGAYAVDVDNERTYKIAETLLAARKPI